MVNPTVISARIVWPFDEDPDASYLDQEGFEARKQEYIAEMFHFRGCYAECTVRHPDGILDTFRSGGLWGIESDIDDDSMRQIETEERIALLSHVVGYGVKDPENIILLAEYDGEGW